MPRPKVDPKDYQSIVNGKPVKVSDLTVEQLQQELCFAMDTIEQMEDKLFSGLAEVNERIRAWHRGS